MAERRGKSEVEAELKISLSPGDLEKVFAALAGRSGASEVSHKFRPRMYYDTPDLLLHQNKLSLRVQYKQGKKGRLGFYEQTVKVELPPDPKAGDGALRRKECKNAVKGHEPEMGSVTDPLAQEALKPFGGKTLVHIFTAAMERRSFNLELKADGKKGTVEVAFDIGRIILPHNNAHEDFSEIEVEIKEGAAECIALVRDDILKIAPAAKIQPLSKAEQGAALYLKHRK